MRVVDSTIERSLPVFAEGSQPDVLFRLCSFVIPVIASSSLGGSDECPTGCLVDGAGVAWRFDEGLDHHGRGVVALGPVLGQVAADEGKGVRAEVGDLDPRQDQEPGVVDHQRQVLLAELRCPADESVARGSENWTAAANAIAEMVPTAERGMTLSDADARLILDWATALTLAGDDRTATRVRQRYLAPMEQTPFADAFDLITTPQERGLVDYRTVRQQIEQAENFQSFLVEYEDLIDDGLSNAVNLRLFKSFGSSACDEQMPRRLNPLSAEFTCMNEDCKHTWHQTTPPAEYCPKCGCHYSVWKNYADWSLEKRPSKEEKAKKRRK